VVRLALLVLCWVVGVVQTQGAARPGPDEAVITLNDFCEATSRHTGETCTTVVTRAQLESLTEALQPGMSAELRAKVAVSYARLLRMAEVAEQRGLDKTPEFALELRYARLQLLSQDLDRALRHEADEVSAGDIQGYYQAHLADYQQATLARILVPGAGKIGVTTDLAQVAADLRVRALQGEDPDSLQAAAYTAAGIPGTSPRTTLKDLRRSSIPPSHEVAFDLTPGQVSEVISDPGGAHFIYKMLQRHTLTLEQATPEIHKLLADQHYRDALKHFSDGTVLNDAYFASSP
jgi:hypothetical protein